MDHFATTIRTYKVIEIYRTYNSNRQLVMIRYDLDCGKVTHKIFGVRHDKLQAHIVCEQKEKR